jgi:hypothetical protein
MHEMLAFHSSMYSIPFGAVAAILIAIALKEPKKNASIRTQVKRIDYAGMPNQSIANVTEDKISYKLF